MLLKSDLVIYFYDSFIVSLDPLSFAPDTKRSFNPVDMGSLTRVHS